MKQGEKYILSVDGQETEIEQSGLSVTSGGGSDGGFGRFPGGGFDESFDGFDGFPGGGNGDKPDDLDRFPGGSGDDDFGFGGDRGGDRRGDRGGNRRENENGNDENRFAV